MRVIAAAFAIGIASLSPASVSVPPPLLPLYADQHWVLMSFEQLRACVVMTGQEPRGSAPNRNLKIYVAGWFSEVRLELPDPPVRYFAPGRTTMVSVDLGPAFRRSLEFRPSVRSISPTLVTDLGAGDLDAIRAALEPSGREMSVRFESGETWRFPTPERRALASAAARCWRRTGIAPAGPLLSAAPIAPSPAPWR